MTSLSRDLLNAIKVRAAPALSGVCCVVFAVASFSPGEHEEGLPVLTLKNIKAQPYIHGRGTGHLGVIPVQALRRARLRLALEVGMDDFLSRQFIAAARARGSAAA